MGATRRAGGVGGRDQRTGTSPGGRRGRVRPTARKVLAALFNSLGPRVEGARVLDLFAGTGAIGVEALRRGARSAVFVERDPRLAEAIRERLRAFGFQDAAQVWRADVRRALRRLAAEGRWFDLIVLDPPYGGGVLQETLEVIAAGPLLRPGTLIVAEGHWRDVPRIPRRLACDREARYGETALWFLSPRGDEEDDRDDRDLPGDVRSRP